MQREVARCEGLRAAVNRAAGDLHRCAVGLRVVLHVLANASAHHVQFQDTINRTSMVVPNIHKKHLVHISWWIFDRVRCETAAAEAGLEAEVQAWVAARAGAARAAAEAAHLPTQVRGVM